MRDEKVTCDGCGADLTTRSNSVDYRLVLGSESKPGYGAGVYTDMMIYPPVDRTHHFCDLACLDHWRDREKHEASLWRDWHEKWKAEKGTKHEGMFGPGSVSWSIPCEPEELRKENAAKFKAAALEAFPISRPSRR